MLSGLNGSPGRSTSAIRASDRTIFRQQNLALRAENAFLRQQNANQNQRTEQLENRLKWYENAHTPSSKQGGAGEQPQNDDSDQEDTDTLNEKDDEDAGGDSDAASDTSSGRNPGHEGVTRPPPDPDRAVRIGEGYCPDCGRVLTDPDEYDSHVVIDIPLPVPTEVVKYELGKHECCGNEIVAEHPECPQEGRFGPRLLAQTALFRYHGRLPHRKQVELLRCGAR